MRIALISLPVAVLTLLASFATGTEESTPMQPQILHVNAPLEINKTVTRAKGIHNAIRLFSEADTPYLKNQAINNLRTMEASLSQKDQNLMESIVTPVLRELSTAKNAAIRMNAIQALPALAPESAFSCLEDLLEEEEDEEVLLLAGQMLGQVANREDLIHLLPYFEQSKKMGLKITVATAWLEAVSRTGMPLEQARIETQLLPTLMEIMESPDTSIRHQRIAHQLETKLRHTYGIGEESLARPVYGIAQ